MSEMPQETHGLILVLTAGGAVPDVLIQALTARFPNAVRVIEESPESKWQILTRRARRLGWIESLGQLATMVVARLGKRLSARRWSEIMAMQDNLPASPSPPVDPVVSLNDPVCHALVAALSPKVVLTVSCRILSPKTLAGIGCPIINFHSGINPGYRGQMGGYWALAENDRDNFGGCVHLVDAGIDTGGMLYVKRLRASQQDSISTYPLLITMGCRDIVLAAVDDALAGTLRPYEPSGASRLRYPPALWTWIFNGLRRGVW
jgi:hypothetical protein